jgi:hypothetical protein
MSLATLAKSPHPRFVRELVLTCRRVTFSDESVDAVRANPAFVNLERLGVERTQR